MIASGPTDLARSPSRPVSRPAPFPRGECAIKASSSSSRADRAPAGAPAVELHGITKRFPGVVANHDIDITVHRGTVHALVGENGAGKSTLMKILYGMQKPDEGTITVDGEQVSFAGPGDAIARGIGMVHQHFMLADNLTVLENVVLGAEKRHGIAGRARARIREISDAYGLAVRPDVLVEELGVADRQRVEILKVLYRGARTLILDEPTAVLVPQEVDALFDNLRELKAEGLTVIFISHKLGEVLSVADDITVIRRGTTVGAVKPDGVTRKELAELMVGSELPSPETRESTVTEVPALTVEGLSLTATDPDGVVRTVLDGVTFTIHQGEVLGIAGVEGNGQAELVEAVMGMRTPDGGTVVLDGEDITTAPTRRRRENGIGYIPEDRHRHGLLLEAPLWENRILGHVTEPPNSRRGLLDIKSARADTRRIVQEYDVRTPGIEVTAASLSGGNQQKLIVGREMSHHPKLLIAAHPTRGVDVGAQAQIWDQIRTARREGLAVLLISADLDELIGLSDTLRVMFRGRLVADADPAAITPEELGSAMTGAAGGHLGTDAPATPPMSQAPPAPGVPAARAASGAGAGAAPAASPEGPAAATDDPAGAPAPGPAAPGNRREGDA
ncbi:ABC transporter ATP-binding protein [Streptomyces zingiberis]|uniref:ABC transporter ATP-binding protein n=1 Tax=Streptomyces zingiberis TaxID=2053010 RepID=A0ABX1BSE2_9ACTN|nr:ABC transporter ATP-binding protein [Streptomyces zingiberis]NJQ00631.1 ABC transporter ATP-binding protein [Streptomyces zingiberis]